RTGGLFVPIGADDTAVEPFNRSGFPLIQSFALRNPLYDVDENDLACQLLLRNALRCGGTDIPGADDGNLIHESHARFVAYHWPGGSRPPAAKLETGQSTVNS